MLKTVTRKYILLDNSSEELVQRVGDGSIITRFDKTPIPNNTNDVICPHFLELKWATGCPYDCAWCYLKGTLRFLPQRAKPYIKDYKKIEQHLYAFFAQSNGHCELLNTGELADSLMAERNGHPFSQFVLSIFSQQDKHRVLFLTKSKNIKNLLGFPYQRYAVISFSLNANPVARQFENGAPTIAERINAAKELSLAGYEVRIRIDPMVPISQWEKEYEALVDLVFASFIPARITLGSLRGLQSTINQAIDKRWVAYLSERSNWGKKVAFPLRFEMFLVILDYLKTKYHYSSISLCKETIEMWNALGMDYIKIQCNCLL